MLCPAENGRKKKTAVAANLFFSQREKIAWIKLVLNFTAGKNYSTITNHSKVSLFSYFKKIAV
jgi:hypothetical protein